MIGNNIQDILDKQGISINMLAKVLGRDYAGVHRLVNRDSLDTTPLATLVEIADYLKVDIKKLYEGDAKMIRIIKESNELDLDMKFYRDDNMEYSLGDRGINDMYRDALRRFDGTYDEFIDLIDNEEHKMFIKWNQLKRYAKQLGKL